MCGDDPPAMPPDDIGARPATRAASPAPTPAARPPLELPRLVERLHRRYLDIVRVELTRLGVAGLTPAQAMQLLNLDHEMLLQEIVDRGHYIGSQALYNVKKLAQAGYVELLHAPPDRRALRIRLTARAAALRARLSERLERVPTGPGDGDLAALQRRLREVGRAWEDWLRYGRG